MELGITFEVCSACQFDCALCAHQGLRAIDPRYHMSMEELETFIRFTEESDYVVDLYMHGPGEPLLWKHLTEGLTRLRASKSVKNISVVSNGVVLKKVLHILDLVDSVHISLYGDAKKEIDHPKVIYNAHPFFLNKLYPAPVPCTCLCSGPMIYKDLIFADCGPPLFDAVKKMPGARDPLSFGVKLGPHYADAPKISGTFAECAYCWANSNCSYEVEAHSTTSTPKTGDLPGTPIVPPGEASSVSVREMVEAAFSRFGAGDFQGADEICTQLIDQGADTFYAYYLSGIVAAQGESWELAGNRLREALNHTEGVPPERISEVAARLEKMPR
jgi:hypothetical protein